MTKVTVTVELSHEEYLQLLTQANEIGVTPTDLAGSIVNNYVRGNQYDEHWVTQDAIESNYVRATNANA